MTLSRWLALAAALLALPGVTLADPVVRPSTSIFRIISVGRHKGTGFLADVRRGDGAPERFLITALHVVDRCDVLEIAEIPRECPSEPDLVDFAKINCDQPVFWAWRELDLALIPLSDPALIQAHHAWPALGGVSPARFLQATRALEIDLRPRGPRDPPASVPTALEVPGPSSEITARLLCQSHERFAYVNSVQLQTWFETVPRGELGCGPEEPDEVCRRRVRAEVFGSLSPAVWVLIDRGGATRGSSGSPVLEPGSSRVLAVRIAGHRERDQGLSVSLDRNALTFSSDRHVALSRGVSGFTRPSRAVSFEGEEIIEAGTHAGSTIARVEFELPQSLALSRITFASGVRAGFGVDFKRVGRWQFAARVGVGLTLQPDRETFRSPDQEILETTQRLLWGFTFEASLEASYFWSAWTGALWGAGARYGIWFAGPPDRADDTNFQQLFAYTGARWTRPGFRVALVVGAGAERSQPLDFVYTGVAARYAQSPSAWEPFLFVFPRLEL